MPSAAAMYRISHYWLHLKSSRRARYLIPRTILIVAAVAVLVIEVLLFSLLGVVSLETLIERLRSLIERLR
jgi:hypothetical protein